MQITKIFTFDAAHALTHYYGKCERFHGHTYTLHVTVEGPIQKNGMVVDFHLLKRVVEKYVIDKVDHQNLNDILINPSTEMVVRWMWNQLKDLPKLLQKELKDPTLAEDLKRYLMSEKPFKPEAGKKMKVKLYELKLFETATSFVTYRGGK